MGNKVLLVVGSLNRPLSFYAQPKGDGLSVWSLDETTGKVLFLSRQTGIDNPCFLSINRDKSVLYANSEVHEWHEGVVSAWQINPATGALNYMNCQPTHGSCAAYNRLSADGQSLFVVNYGILNAGPDQALAILPVDGVSGALLPPSASHALPDGTGPNKNRQDRSHPHAVLALVAASHRMLLIPDLGTDRLHRLLAQPDGRFEGLEPLLLPPGSGPRHLVAHPRLPVIYLVNELNSTLAVLELNGCELSIVQIVSTLPAGFVDENDAADIVLSSDGQHLYVSNRGADCITGYTLDATTGAVQTMKSWPSGGRTPRSLELTQSGQCLLATNQNSDNITVFRRDGYSGMLTRLSAFDLGSPVAATVNATRLLTLPSEPGS
eukprot:gene16468-16647_t